MHGNRSDEDGEESSRPWTKRMELPTFEGSDQLERIARVEKILKCRTSLKRKNYVWLSSI